MSTNNQGIKRDQHWHLNYCDASESSVVLLWDWSFMPTFQAFPSSRHPHFYPATAISEYLYAVLCLVAQLCPTLCNPMDYTACQAPLSLEILQARILEWVAMPSSRGSSQPRDRTWNTSNWWLFWSKHCFDCLFLVSAWDPWEFWFNWFGYWSPRADCLNRTSTIQVALRSQRLRKRYKCVPKRNHSWMLGRGRG